MARDLGDLDALHSVLLVAEMAHLSLTPPLRAIAQAAFLATTDPERIQDHQLLETLRLLDPDDPGLPVPLNYRAQVYAPAELGVCRFRRTFDDQS